MHKKHKNWQNRQRKAAKFGIKGNESMLYSTYYKCYNKCNRKMDCRHLPPLRALRSKKVPSSKNRIFNRRRIK